MYSPDLVRSTPYFLLLSAGNVALLLIIIRVRNYSLGPHPLSSPRLPGVQFAFPLVLMLGFLTAFSGTLGLIGLGIEQIRTPSSAHPWIVAQESLEIIIKLACELGSNAFFLDF
jgi:hypothetical protein